MPTLEDIKNKLKSSAGTRSYGMGQKVSTKEFGEFWNPSRRGTLLVEMGFGLISKSSTKISGIKVVALCNLETANNMYAGNIQCEPNQYSCLTRRKVGMHKYRSVLDAFATLQAKTQGVCIMKRPVIPVDVLMANSEADRTLDNPEGWITQDK